MHDDVEASGTTQSCINLEMTVVKKKNREEVGAKRTSECGADKDEGMGLSLRSTRLAVFCPPTSCFNR